MSLFSGLGLSRKPAREPLHQDGLRLTFMVSTVRQLLLALRDSHTLAGHRANEAARKALDELYASVSQEPSLSKLETTLEGCRNALAHHTWFERAWRAERQAELQRATDCLARHLNILAAESQAGVVDLEACAERLERGQELKELSSMRKVLVEQACLLQSQASKQRRRQGAALAELRDQLAVLSKTFGFVQDPAQ